MSNMSNPVSKSTADDRKGTDDPNRILPIADTNIDKNERQVGFMYRGNEYGQGTAWITCEQGDLATVNR